MKTQFGYHIIRLDEIQAGKGKSFEEARSELEAQLRRDRATDRFGEIQEQLQSKLAEPGADLDALAQQYKLQPGDVPSFAQGRGRARRSEPRRRCRSWCSAIRRSPPARSAGRYCSAMTVW